MAVNPIQLVAPQQLTNASATYYTSTNIKTRIDKLSCVNTTAGAVTVTIYIVPSGGSVGASTTLTSARALAAGETWNCPDVVGQIMAAADTLRALASANTSITIMASGTQISP